MSDKMKQTLNTAPHRLTVILGLLSVVFVTLQFFAPGETSGTVLAAELAARPAGPNAVVNVGEGFDYASEVLGDPWDMAAINDIYNEKSQNVTSTAGTDRLAIDNGMLVGKTTSDDPQIFLKWPGFGGYQNAYTKYGVNTPINADRYRYFVMRMYVDNAPTGAVGRLLWARDFNLSQFGLSKPISIQAGWFTYVVDLKTIGLDGGTENWTGNFQGLRLGPINQANVNFKIDWIRLVSETDLPTYTVPFQANAGVISLYAAPTNSQGDKTTVIATGLNAGNNSYTWPAGLMTPADYYIYETSGIDYAGLSLGTPWNMTNTDQFTLNELAVNSQRGGVLNVTPTGSDPYIVFTLDSSTPIDGSIFDQFAIKMTTSGLKTGQFYAWQIYWRVAGTTDLKSIDFTGRTLTAGENVYSVDMAGNADWAGKQIDYLRFDVLSNGSMSALNLAIDWAALTTGIVPSSEGQLAATGSFAPNWVEVKAAPIAKATAPSYTSGADYATTVLGDAWDMDSAGDIIAMNEIQTSSFSAGILNFTDDDTTNPGGTLPCLRTGDPQLSLRTGQYFADPRTGIDPARYRYVTYRYKEDHRTDTCLGSIARFLAWENSTADTTEFEASVTNEGWNTYVIDLATGPTSPNVTPWASHQTLNVFRFDPNEIPGIEISGHLDYVTLTSKPWADTSYTVKWSASSGDADTQVKIYRDTDTNASNGKTLVATTTLGASSYLWNTSALAQGDYYIYLEMIDGVNQPRGVYSELPVTVKRQAAVTFTTPTRSASLSADFATKNGNEWDFADDSDLRKTAPAPAAGYQGLTNVTVNGTFNAVSTSTDPNIFLNMPGGATIDTNQYNRLRFRMYSGHTGGVVNAQLFWNQVGGGSGSTSFIEIYPGWNVYDIDLQANTGWTGSVQLLRMDPVAQTGITFSIDWIHLTGSKTLNVTWTKQNFDGATQVSLQATPVGGGEPIWIARNQTGANFAWDVAGLQPGEYTVTAWVDDRVSDINQVVDGQNYTLVGAGTPLLQTPATVTVLVQVGVQRSGIIPIINGGGGTLTWSATSNQSWLSLTKSTGSTLFADQVEYRVDASALSVGAHTATITVNGGAGGAQSITVTAIVAKNVLDLYLPFVRR